MSETFKADQEGRMAGHAAGGLVEIDNKEAAVEMLRILEGSSTEVLDFPPAPLSGEWAGESIEELSTKYGVDLHDDENATAFENAWQEAWHLEVTRRVRQFTDLFVVSFGNAFEGLTFYGPFETIEEGIEWAENNASVEFNVVTVEFPI